MSINVSIVICTYNRAEFLEEALRSLVNQAADQNQYEVIVVNNNSTDRTLQTAARFVSQQPNFRVVTEPEQGLSHARNRGYKEARADWVAYMDDDARAFKNYVERILYIIRHYDFDCFGGMYLPWYKYGKPKWFLDSYGSNGRLLEKPGVLEKHNASGGIIVFKKSVLEHFEGFPSSLGMQGTKVAYGEESLVQIKMRREGYTVGFDPELQIEHVVGRHKLTPYWFVLSEFARGRDSWSKNEIDADYGQLFNIIVRSCYQLLKNLKSDTPKLFQRGYYVQNWFIEVFATFANSLGRFYGGLKKRMI